jgi:protein SCO1/2
VVNDKTSRILLIFAAFLSGLVLFFGVILFVTGRSPSPIGSAAAAVGGPFHLQDQSGKTVTEQDMKGKPFLVFFGFTRCPDICPTTLLDMSQVFQQLGPDADRIGALFITVDPEHDTPALMKDYLSNFDPHVRGLTGDQAAIDQAIKAYRVYAKKVPLKDGDYTMDHTAIVYLMNKSGDFVAPFDLTRQTPQAAATELRKYM